MSGIHGPGAALDFHVRLFADLDRINGWIDQNEGRRVANASVPRMFQQRSVLITASSKMLARTLDGEHTLAQDRPWIVGTPENMASTALLMQTERHILNEGATWYVSQQIAATVSSFADAAEPEPLFHTDLPADCGLIVLETPLLLDDLHPDTGEIVPGLHMPITAIAWKRNEVAMPVDGEMRQVPGITYYLYTRTDQWMEHYLPACRRLLDATEADTNEAIASRTEWCFMSDYSGWSFGSSWRVGNVADSRPGYVPDSVSFMRRWLLAFFRFTWQQILVGHTHHPTRAERRRFDRVKSHVPKDGYIKVVRLRREVEAEARGERPTPGDTIRNHQWLVRGHPRRQWYPSLGPARNADGSFNHDSHRLIWIEAHTAGNPFGELVRGHEVVAVVR